jgi:hypothetical protein
MKANNLTFFRSAGLVAGAMLALSGVSLLGGEKTIPADAFPNFDSYIKVSGQAASVSGDGASYQARARQPENGTYGIEDFHYAKDTSKDVTMTIDGHALVGSEDYLGQVKFTKNEVGTFDVGYKRFRTFYDGVGGFFSNNANAYYPGTQSYYPGTATTYNGQAYTPTATYLPWQPLAKEALSLDRGKFWVEATLAMPDKPVFSVKYVNELRNGKKDSTIWGDTSLTGLPTSGYLQNPISPVRKITPSWINVGERHENLEATVSHTYKKVTASFTVFSDKTSNLDTRYVVRFPGEAKIFAVPSSTLTGKLVSSINTNNQIQQYQTDGMASDTTGMSGKLDVALTDTLTLKLAGAYEKVSNEVTGDRPLVTATPSSPSVIPSGPNDPSVQQIITDNNANLFATVKLQELNGSVALDWKASKDLSVKVGVKTSEEWFHSDGGFTAVTSAQSSTTGVVTYTSTPRIIWARLHESGTTPVVDVRYTGIKNVSLYFTGSQRDISGDERNVATYTPSTGVTSNALNQSVSDKAGNYKLGANWRVSNQVTLRGEVYQKTSKIGVPSGTLVSGASTTNLYYLADLKHDGYKLSAIVKPMPELSFTTRFIYEKGTGQVTGTQPTVPTFDSLASKNYQFGETIDWAPSRSVYVQLSGNIVFNDISTIYPRAGTYPANSTANPPVGAYDVNRVLQNSVNNYTTFTALAGWAAAAHTDVQVQFSQYKASNANANAGLWTVPYGVACSDTQTTLGIKHQFNDKLVMNAKVGYFDSKNDTTGGMTNYKGPMAYVAFEHAL